MNILKGKLLLTFAYQLNKKRCTTMAISNCLFSDTFENPLALRSITYNVAQMSLTLRIFFDVIMKIKPYKSLSTF